MRHEAHNVSLQVAYARDVFHRAVGICLRVHVTFCVRVAKNDLIVVFEFGERLGVAEVVSLAVRDSHFESFFRLDVAGEGGSRRFAFEPNIIANEAKRLVSSQGSGQEARFGQALKTVAYAEQGAPIPGMRRDGLHDGRETRYGAGSQIIPVAEASGEYHHLRVSKRGFLMPHEPHWLFENVLDGVVAIMVAIGTREDDDSEMHHLFSPFLDSFAISIR